MGFGAKCLLLWLRGTFFTDHEGGERDPERTGRGEAKGARVGSTARGGGAAGARERRAAPTSPAPPPSTPRKGGKPFVWAGGRVGGGDGNISVVGGLKDGFRLGGGPRPPPVRPRLHVSDHGARDASLTPRAPPPPLAPLGQDPEGGAPSTTEPGSLTSQHPVDYAFPPPERQRAGVSLPLQNLPVDLLPQHPIGT